MNPTRLSKFLSLILRHEPQKIGIVLDDQGWVDCEQLITAAANYGLKITPEGLYEIVVSNEKQRFAFNADRTRIRANQGHSVKINLGLTPIAPPRYLYHGTVEKFLESIRYEGLKKGERHHVHLSSDLTTASKVGQRRGKPIILKIRSAEMFTRGLDFYQSANGVWLTDSVPAEFIEINLHAITLYRPVGPEELALIEASGWKEFPRRLPDQPIFYPVTNEAYAIQIARDWNVKASGSGFVTRFFVDHAYLDQFPVQTVGGRQHTELWIPAEELPEFNRHIIGKIEVTQSFP